MAISLIKEEERHILEVLPILLKRDDLFRAQVYTVLSDTFATRVDLKIIIEEINKRFEKQTEEINKRFKEEREETNKRFEEINKRFEQVDKRFESLEKAIAKLSINIRTVGARWGIEAEGTIRNTLKGLLLKRLDVKDVSRWKIKDKEGKVGSPNTEIEIDLLIKNGEHILIEIKSSADEAHVDRFYKIGDFYQEENGIKPTLIFVAVDMKRKGERRCFDLGIQLITYDELEDEL